MNEVVANQVVFEDVVIVGDAPDAGPDGPEQCLEGDYAGDCVVGVEPDTVSTVDHGESPFVAQVVVLTLLSLIFALTARGIVQALHEES